MRSVRTSAMEAAQAEINGNGAHGGPLVQPHNLEAEESVLGAMMVSEAALDPVFADVRLASEDFYRGRHGVDLRGDPRPLRARRAGRRAHRLRAAAQPGQARGGRRPRGGLQRSPRPRPAPATPATTPRSSSRTRCCGGCSPPPSGSSSRSTRARASPRSSSSRPSACSSTSPATSRRATSARSARSSRTRPTASRSSPAATPQITGTPSGFRKLDEITGGFQPGNLIVIAARPAMGKSSLVCNIAENVAWKAKRPVAFFSLEMSETELAHRFIASRARISCDRLRKGQVAQGLEEGAEGLQRARRGAAVDRRLLRPRPARPARQVPAPARLGEGEPRAGHRRLPPADAHRRPARRAASSRSGR